MTDAIEAIIFRMTQFKCERSFRMQSTSYYQDRESKSLEFKSKLPNFNSLVKTCISFANGAGGELIIGIEDKTHKIIGISDKVRERMYDDFPNCLYDSVSPLLMPQIYEKNIGDKQILIIKIWPGAKKPYFLKKDGTPKGIYVRIGTSTRRASEEAVEELIREQRHVPFDEDSSGLQQNILSQKLIQQLYGKYKSDSLLISEKVLVPQSNQMQLSPSNGGILMFCELPDIHIPEAMVICTRFAGRNGRSIIQSMELRGPIPQLIQASYNLVLEWLERDYSLQGPKLRGKLLIPEEALREAVINALVHRKYSTPGSVKIALFDNRLEIFSPGSFPGLISIKNLGDGTTYLRNHVVARIARKMRIMEKLGSGIRLIFESCEKLGIKRPEYREDGDFVKLIFYFEKAPRHAVLSDEDILSLAEDNLSIKPSDIAKHFKISRSSITRALTALVNRKKLKRFGKGAGVYYQTIK